MKRFPFPLAARRPALPRADGRRVGVALPAPLPPLWRGRRRHRVPLGRGDPARERGDDRASCASAPTSGRSASRSSAPTRRRWARRRRSSPTCSSPSSSTSTSAARSRRSSSATAARAASRISTSCRRSSAPSRASTSLPVTCKIRSGWNEEMRDPVTIALRCQDAGARALALHPRTRTQMYTGSARWEEIAAVVDGARHPGARQRRHQDARGRHAHAARDRVRRRHDRARLVRPAVDLRPGARPARGPADARRRRRSRSASRSRSSTRAWRSDYEPDRRGAAIEFRKHLGWYVKGLPGSAELRKRLHAVTSLGEVEGIFDDYLRSTRPIRAPTPTTRRRRAAGDRRGMRREHVRDLLRQVADGSLDVDARARRAVARAGRVARLRDDRPSPRAAAGLSRSHLRRGEDAGADRARSRERIAARGDGVLVDAHRAPTPPTALAASLPGRRS